MQNILQVSTSSTGNYD